MKVIAYTPHGGADSQFKCFNQIAKSYFKKKPYQGYYLLMTFKLSMANCDTVQDDVHDLFSNYHLLS